MDSDDEDFPEDLDLVETEDSEDDGGMDVPIPIPTWLIRPRRSAKFLLGGGDFHRGLRVGAHKGCDTGCCENHKVKEESDNLQQIVKEAGWKVKQRKGKLRNLKNRKKKEVNIKDKLKILETIEPEGLCHVDVQGGWVEFELAVDSGATETVVSEEMLTMVETKPGAASKRGVEYEVANGVRIPNLGEKKFMAETEDGVVRSITAQVCDVNKALLSVKKVVAAGNRVVFDDGGSYIEDKSTGERMWMIENNGMYMLKLWIPKQPFPRQG